MKTQNVGSRPADDALVVLNVQGDVFLRPPKRNEEDEEMENDYQESLKLSPAPSAPQGRWERMDPWSVSSSIARLASNVNWQNDGLLRPIFRNAPLQRDPNALYFKEGERGRLNKHIEYECAQWRHAQPAEEFQMDVVCPFKPGIYSALVSAEVHAANLTHPKVVQLPIKILVEESSCLEIAQEMVAALES